MRAEMVVEGPVARLHDEFSSLQKFLSENGAPQHLPAIEDVFPKTMLLAAASYFESRLSREVERIAVDATGDGHVLVWLVRRGTISRQFHTWFDWKARNANRFFQLFGDDFMERAKESVNRDERLKQSVADFLEIGRERNSLVHENFGDFAFGKTAEDVIALYNSAKVFVDWFPTAVKQYSVAASQG